MRSGSVLCQIIHMKTYTTHLIWTSSCFIFSCPTATVSTAPPAASSAAPATSSLLDVEGLLGLPPSLLQITEDQLPGTSFTSDPNTHFVSFSPPIDHDDYLWSLEDGEGVSDFFDAYDLGDLLKSWCLKRGGYIFKQAEHALWSHHSFLAMPAGGLSCFCLF